MSVITVFTKMHCRRLVLDQVEQLGSEVGDNHVGSSSPHASRNLFMGVVIKHEEETKFEDIETKQCIAK